jgi:FkbM family methyltransferase
MPDKARSLSAVRLAAAAGLVPPRLLRMVGRWQLRSPTLRRIVDAATRTMRQRDLVVRHGMNAGLKFNPAGSFAGYAFGTTEPQLQAALVRELHHDATFYDLGANVGFFTVLGARCVGPCGQVYAFEPLPENVTGLRHNIELNGFENVEVVPAAVSEAVGQTELEKHGHQTAARIGTPEVPATPGRRHTIVVPTVTLDHALAAGRRPPDVVKIDIEGAEVAAIRGARRTLAQHRPVLFCALHGTNQAFVDAVAELGYEVEGLDFSGPIHEGGWNAMVVCRPLA